MAISENTLAVLQDAPQPNMLPDEFNQKAFAFAAIQYTLGLEINATVAALNLNSTNSTSTDSMAIGLGDKNFEVEVNKSYSLGMSVRIAADIDPTNWMNGDVIAYDPATGNITVHVTSTQGSGTYSAWSISQSVGGLTSGSVDTDKLADGVLSLNAAGLAKMVDGFLQATAAGRAKMADSFVNAAKILDGAATLAKLDRTGAAWHLLASNGVGNAPSWLGELFLGVNQTLQNVTSTRALNTTYTNSTGKPIFVSVHLLQSAGGSANLQIDGGSSYQSSNQANVGISLVGVVPAGSTYRVVPGAGTGSLVYWSELRA